MKKDKLEEENEMIELARQSGYNECSYMFENMINKTLKEIPLCSNPNCDCDTALARLLKQKLKELNDNRTEKEVKEQ